MIQEKWSYVLSVDGREIELTDGEVTLGRSRTSTVRVDHESVSRSHALLVFDKGLAILKDLNSSNGTYVGGRRVHNETKLADGDRIQLGAAVIGFKAIAPGPSDKTDLLISDPVPPVPPAGSPAVPPPPVPAAPAVPAAQAAEAPAAMPVEAEPPSVPFPVLEPPPAPRPKSADELSMEIEGGPTRRQEDIPAFRAQQAVAAAPAPVPPPPPAPVAAAAPPPPSPPIEIAAEELFRDVDARAGQPPSPAPVVGAAAAALEAVRASAAPIEPPPPPPPPAPSREPAPPPPVPRVPEEPRSARPPASRSSRSERATMRPAHESSLSQMSFREADIELSMMAPRPRQSGPPTARESADPPSLAGFFPRAVANLVDLVILMAIDLLLSSPVFLILFFRVPGTGPDLALWGVSALCGILILAANLWYVVGGWAKNGRTPGKSLLGLAVVTSEARLGPGLGWRIAVIRLLGAGVAVLPLFAGYLMVLFRKDRRGLHDILANTWVVRS